MVRILPPVAPIKRLPLWGIPRFPRPSSNVFVGIEQITRNKHQEIIGREPLLKTVRSGWTLQTKGLKIVSRADGGLGLGLAAGLSTKSASIFQGQTKIARISGQGVFFPISTSRITIRNTDGLELGISNEQLTWTSQQHEKLLNNSYLAHNVSTLIYLANVVHKVLEGKLHQDKDTKHPIYNGARTVPFFTYLAKNTGRIVWLQAGKPSAGQHAEQIAVTLPFNPFGCHIKPVEHTLPASAIGVSNILRDTIDTFNQLAPLLLCISPHSGNTPPPLPPVKPPAGPRPANLLPA